MPVSAPINEKPRHSLGLMAGAKIGGSGSPKLRNDPCVFCAFDSCAEFQTGLTEYRSQNG